MSESALARGWADGHLGLVNDSEEFKVAISNTVCQRMEFVDNASCFVASFLVAMELHC